MAVDEMRTLSELKNIQETIIRPHVARHHGRIIRLLGDGAFIEFASPVDAVICAAQIQRTMAERSRSDTAGQSIQYRIGIHFGDVIVDDGDLFGNGVNLAARLEAKAKHGGVLVSEQVFEEVKDKTDLGFQFAGSHRLKNVPGAIAVFEILGDGLNSRDIDGSEKFIGAAARLPLIALLPFQTLSEGSDRELIVSGINEELALALNRFSDISIIASESARKYGDVGHNVIEIGQDLSVDYLVNGSVIRDGDRLRLFIRLFETSGGELIWSDRYDGDQSDIFALQDEVAHDLASRLPLRIERDGLARIRRKPTYSLDAYECFLQGRELYRMKSHETDLQAIDFLQQAIEIDPNFADPYAILGAIRAIGWTYSSWGIDPSEDIAAGRKLIRQALELNSELPRAHGHLGWTYLSTRDFEKSMEHLNIAVSLNPNDVDVLLLKAYAICYMGEPEESIRICKELMRLNPNVPLWYMDVLATAQFVAGRYAESLRTYETVPDLFPENLGWMAACLAYLDRPQEAQDLAKQFVEQIRSIWKGPPDAGSSDYVDWWLHTASSFKFEKDADALETGIRMAGLPN